MNTSSVADKLGGVTSRAAHTDSRVEIEISPTAHADATHFRAALDRHIGAAPIKITPADNKGSLATAIAERTNTLATSVNKDQQYVSKLLEQATRSGNSMELMKAMMALNDYQLRVQTISKSVSKASSAIDQLTKLQ